MTVHALKSWPEFYAALAAGAKNSETRKNDRTPPFEKGDVLRLKEWDPVTERYTGRETFRAVSYIYDLSVLGHSEIVVMELRPALFAGTPKTPEGLGGASVFWPSTSEEGAIPESKPSVGNPPREEPGGAEGGG